MRCICSRIASGDFADLKRGDFADDFRACEIPLSIRVRKVVFGFVFGLRNSPSRPANAMYISQIVHWGGVRGRQKMHICRSAEFPLWGISRTQKGEISQTCFGYLKPHAQINTGKGYFGRHSNIGTQIPTKIKKNQKEIRPTDSPARLITISHDNVISPDNDQGLITIRPLITISPLITGIFFVFSCFSYAHFSAENCKFSQLCFTYGHR